MKWIMGLLCPVLFIILAFIILIAKPKRNTLFGYRTTKSMSSDTLWNFANKLMSISMIVTNIIICIPAICLINVFVSSTLAIVLLDLGIAFLGLIFTIIITQIFINKKSKNK